MQRCCSLLFCVVLLALTTGPLRAQPWDTNGASVHYEGRVGIGTEWPKADLDVKGYRTHVVTNTSSDDSPFFTSLGSVDARRSVWIRATDSGCNLGGSVLYHIAGGYMGGAAPRRRLKVYSLGDNDAYPAVEDHFDVYVSKVGSSKYRLGLLHKGGCDGSSKRVRFAVTASHYTPSDTDASIGNYDRMSVRRYLYQDGDGNVGIGEPNPSKKLAVNGHVRAKEVIVEADGWSDYVFRESYDLPTLAEVSAFIDEEGHLPSVPAAEEVEENGLRLGEMDATLLRKVEELTLYAIEQKRRADRLAIRADSLSAQVQHLRSRDDRQRKRNEAQQKRLNALEHQNRRLRKRLRHLEQRISSANQ